MTDRSPSFASALLLLCLSAVSGGVCLAASEYVPTFFDMDKDGDNVISAAEADYWSALRKVWDRVDANRDGVLDMQEWNDVDAAALTAEDRR